MIKTSINIPQAIYSVSSQTERFLYGYKDNKEASIKNGPHLQICLGGVCVPLNLLIPFLIGLAHRNGWLKWIKEEWFTWVTDHTINNWICAEIWNHTANLVTPRELDFPALYMWSTTHPHMSGNMTMLLSSLVISSKTCDKETNKVHKSSQRQCRGWESEHCNSYEMIKSSANRQHVYGIRLHHEI